VKELATTFNDGPNKGNDVRAIKMKLATILNELNRTQLLTNDGVEFYRLSLIGFIATELVHGSARVPIKSQKTGPERSAGTGNGKMTKKSESGFRVGDKARVSMHGGQIIDAVIKAIVDKTDGPHYQIEVGKQQTALISEQQVVRE
jgi:hypothetical protein